MTRNFNGWHMFAILCAFFGVVIAVNITMATYASTTFGGIVVENSYVASQEFNRWLDEAKAERALGWQAFAKRTASGKVEIALTGAPADVTLAAEARHPLGRLPDRALHFAAIGDGRFLSRESLPAGRWTLRLEARAGKHVWREEEPIQ
ncbi:MAG: FixH family protein [Novosphingobium sp.]|nr:FixH family protein [Novosphingobium sp.]